MQSMTNTAIQPFKAPLSTNKRNTLQEKLHSQLTRETHYRKFEQLESFHSIFLFFLLLSIAAAQPRTSNITIGSSLTPTGTSYWSSPSALFSFGFFPQNANATAVGIFLPNKTVVWTANRDNPTVPNDVVSLQLTTDGRLILRRRQGQDVNLIPTSAPIASASMLDSGNFVLYNSNSRIIWQSFDHPTNSLLPGQRLSPPDELFSSASETDYGRRIFRLKMQTDGNLVQYPVNTPDTASNAYYSTRTANAGSNVSLNLDRDGRLYLLNGSALLMNITVGGFPTQGSLSLMRLDVGGIFRLYTLSLNPLGNLTQRWSSGDACDPYGLCGVNALCLLKDQLPECECLPGFDFLQSGNITAGCSRSFPAQACPGIDDGLKYEMRPIENTIWKHDPYEILNTVTQDDCTKACLDDCICEVAFFGGNQCRKQKLPLTYGRRSLQNSNIALIRMSTTSNTKGDSDKKGDPDIKRVTKERRRLDILIIGIVLMFMGVFALSFSVIFVSWKWRDYNKIGKDEGGNLVEDISLQAFTFEYLSKATDDFKEELGRGAYGVVYKGTMQTGKVVAVKRLEREVAQGDRAFQTELKTIGKTYNRNLVRLLGYCLEGANKLLVLEYMSNGSLADVLFKPENRPVWEQRIKIARDISRGILYLHQECETQIIHCDIKPQNILMDENWCAKISDFGLAKLLKQDQTNTYTGIRGTKGYVAPEWYQKQAITVKADVYSFGIMLLEIICCRRCVDGNLCDEEAILEYWVYDCYRNGKVGNLVGEEIEIVGERQVERMVKIGIWCVQNEPSLRPTMKKVLLMLEGTVDIPIPPSPTSFLSSV